MNKAKAQQAIETLISNFHKRIGGKAVRRQYEPAKHQIATLTDLGLIDLMPDGFGHGDAKVVIEAATATTGGFNAYGEGETWSNELQDAMNESDEEQEERFYEITLPMDMLWQDASEDDYNADATEIAFADQLYDDLYKAGYENLTISWSTVVGVTVRVDNSDGEEVNFTDDEEIIRHIINQVDVNYIEMEA